jgi:CheY-like chemotaxis protein
MTSILVVEDSPVDRCLISGLLTKEPAWTVETAEHGLAALEKIGQAVPDLVLTDLQMPQMDGLDLVAAVRAEYPGLPIILMTAHGSESLAVEALKSGAASYVPKSQLADILQSTVREVLALTAANRGHERLIESLTSTEFCFSLENDPSLIDAVVDLMQQMLSGIGLCEPSQRLQLGVVLDQALRNAMYHGNLELSVEQMQEACEDLIRGRGARVIDERRRQTPYCRRKIAVNVRIAPDEARFTVRDEGPGFDVAAVLAQDHCEALEGTAGRGLLLMRTFMDEVTFNERGNEVTMIRRKQSSGESAVGSGQWAVGTVARP